MPEVAMQCASCPNGELTHPRRATCPSCSEREAQRVFAEFNIQTFSRYVMRPDGTLELVTLPACKCGDLRRGPAGGVCGACALAIP